MKQLRRTASRLCGIVFTVALSLSACGISEKPATFPPTAEVAIGSSPTSQARQSPPPLEYESPHCYTEAKDPTTGQGLTDADCTEATELAMEEPRVLQLLDGLSYHWQMVVLWHRDGGGLVGAVVTLDLEEPASIEGEWLGITPDCTPNAAPPYHSTPYRQALTNLDQVSVWVDLNLHKIAGVVPGMDPGHSGMPIGTPTLVDPQATWPPGCTHQD